MESPELLEFIASHYTQNVGFWQVAVIELGNGDTYAVGDIPQRIWRHLDTNAVTRPEYKTPIYRSIPVSS